MMFKIGFRNIFRNKRRTLIAIFALGFGIGALILADGFILGSIITMRDESINTITGDFQIHKKQFLDNNDIDLFFSSNELEKKLEKNKHVKMYAKRIISGAMLSSAQSTANVSLYGIMPELERDVFKLKKVIIDGEYFPREKTIMIGAGTAKLLDVRVGEKISITTTKAGDGELVQELFRVGGIFRFGTREFDKYVAFISYYDASKLFNIVDGQHEIVIKIRDDNDGGNDEISRKLQKIVSDKSLEIKSWQDLMPSLRYMIDMSSYSSLIISVVLLVIVAFGIMNTMFMSIYERIYEFGILKSVGTTPKQIFMMILYESFFLGAFGAFLGIIIGVVTSFWFKSHGIDYSEIELGAIGFTEPLVPAIRIYQYIISPLAFWIFTVVVSIYPALFAAKINPIKAIRE